MSTHRVTLLPSQHQYLASSKQSLLRAGLESGLNLLYGCDGGNCGKCLVRLVSGHIQRIKHSDFILSPEQKNNQLFLSCCHAATSDLQMDAVEVGDVADIPVQSIEVRVHRMDRLSETVMSVVFKTPRNQPLQFLAGQYVTLSVDGRFSRNKSIASCPCDGLNLEVHVKYRPENPFSNYVFYRLKKNERVLLSGPQGDFVLDDESTRPLLLIAFDTGFASIKSLLEHAIALELEQPIKLIWILSPNNQPYLNNYCRSLVHALDNFSFQSEFILEKSEDALTKVLEKIMEGEAQLKESDLYLTLPEAYRDLASELFLKRGLDLQNLRIDTIQSL